MIFASESLPTGKPGRWELLFSADQIEFRHHFSTCFEIRPRQSVDGVPARKVCHDYFGPFCMDFDGDAIDIEAVRGNVLTVMALFHAKGLDPRHPAIRYSFSGKKGYHVVIPPQLFGVTDFVYGLGRIYASIVRKMGIDDVVDMLIYNGGQGRMWRLHNRKRKDNGLHKIPLTFEELESRGSDVHLQWARNPRDLPYINNVDLRPIDGLKTLFDDAVARQQEKIATPGISHADVKSLIPPGFQIADCVRLMLENPESSIVFHKLIFLLALYFKMVDLDLGAALAIVEPWLKSKTSKSYPTEQDRITHFEDTFCHVRGADYCFSCAYMIRAAPGANCVHCPLAVDPPSEALERYNGIRIFKNQYVHKVLDRKTKEFIDVPASNAVIKPVAVAHSTPEDPTGAFEAVIQFTDNRETSLIPLDFNEFGTWEKANAAIQRQLGVGQHVFALFPANQRLWHGVRILLGDDMIRLPHYLDAKKAQGMHEFLGKLYWVDVAGCRDSAWNQSVNVRLSQRDFITGSGATQQTLTSKEPIDDMEVLRDFFTAANDFQEPHVGAATIGFAVASFFRMRFRILKTRNCSFPDIDSFPLFQHTGSAGCGKSQLDKTFMMPLFGYKGLEIQLPNLTFFTVMSVHLAVLNCTPALMDEFKPALLEGTSSCVQVDNVNSFARATWEGAGVYRGHQDQTTEVYYILSALKLNGPELVTGLDQATMDRSIHVHSSKSQTTARSDQFKSFLTKFSKTEIPGRIGAFLAKRALSISDEEILLGLQTVTEHIESKAKNALASRQIAGLAKIAFGHWILQRAGHYSWIDSMAPLLKTMIENFSPESGYGADRVAGLPDWHKLLIDMIDMMSSGSSDLYLVPRTHFWFVTGKINEIETRMLIVNIKAYFELRAQKLRRIPGVMISSRVTMSAADWVGMLQAEQLTPRKKKLWIESAAPPNYGTNKVSGYFVPLIVSRLTKLGVDVSDLPGAKDID